MSETFSQNIVDKTNWLWRSKTFKRSDNAALFYVEQTMNLLIVLFTC